MLKRTYDKIYNMFDKAGGYVPTRAMLAQRISTIHIRELYRDGDIEKVSHGNYWGTFLKIAKPSNYRMIEACMTNPKSVICGPSACFYHGLVKKEPGTLYVATCRTDRGGMKLNFDMSRHYFSNGSFEDDIVTFTYHDIVVRVYDVDRSVGDSIRMKDEIGEKQLDEILKAYGKYDDRDVDHLLRYADEMRVGRIVRSVLSDKKII